MFFLGVLFWLQCPSVSFKRLQQSVSYTRSTVIFINTPISLMFEFLSYLRVTTGDRWLPPHWISVWDIMEPALVQVVSHSVSWAQFQWHLESSACLESSSFKRLSQHRVGSPCPSRFTVDCELNNERRTSGSSQRTRRLVTHLSEQWADVSTPSPEEPSSCCSPCSLTSTKDISFFCPASLSGRRSAWWRQWQPQPGLDSFLNHAFCCCHLRFQLQTHGFFLAVESACQHLRFAHIRSCLSSGCPFFAQN